MSSDSDQNFLFAPSLQSKRQSTARKVRIRRLYDILNLCIQRDDFERAKRVWDILVKCPEFDTKTMWPTALHIASQGTLEGLTSSQCVDLLRGMMLRNSEQREVILRELIMRLILEKQYQEALDELELYLPSFPYHEDPLLHTYAGLVSLYLAQPTSSGPFDPRRTRAAQSHFEQVLILDPANKTALTFLEKIPLISQGTTKAPMDLDSDLDEALMEEPSRDSDSKRLKRAQSF